MSQLNSPMNFLPDDYVEKRQAARSAIVFIGLLLVVVGGIVGAFMYTQWQMKTVFDERDRINGQYEDASKKIAEAQQLEGQKEQLVKKAENINMLMERVPRSALLLELSRLLPKNVIITSLDLKSKQQKDGAGGRPNSDLERARRQQAGLPPEEHKTIATDVSLTVTAVAKTNADVATYIAALGKSTLLTDVSLQFSEEYKPSKDDSKPAETLHKFQVEMRVNPDADLRRSPLVEAAHQQ